MSSNISGNDVYRKIREGVYKTFERDTTKNDLWRCFLGISKADGSTEGQNCVGVTEIPTFSAGNVSRFCRTTKSKVERRTCDVTLPPASQQCKSARQ